MLLGLAVYLARNVVLGMYWLASVVFVILLCASAFPVARFVLESPRRRMEESDTALVVCTLVAFVLTMVFPRVDAWLAAQLLIAGGEAGVGEVGGIAIDPETETEMESEAAALENVQRALDEITRRSRERRYRRSASRGRSPAPHPILLPVS